jgi:hypothetical protein
MPRAPLSDTTQGALPLRGGGIGGRLSLTVDAAKLKGSAT